MLGSLLPGLREVRAPLAAGYLWLVIAWLLFEPSVPERAEAEGLVASLYRAGDLVSAIGLGVVLSFAAYLLGSLSASALTPLAHRGFPRAWPTAPRAPLSPQALAALAQIVRRSLDKLTASLAFTDSDLDRFLADQTQTGFLEGDIAPQRPSKIMLPAGTRGPGSAEPVDVDAARREWLARLVLDDLDIVANTRLLGRDQELYAEVDRKRAETELRLAIIPPLLVVPVAMLARSEWLLAAIVGVLVVLLAWGLFADAIRSERAANQILLQSIADRRVHSPVVERLETTAAEQAGRGRPELLEAAARDAVIALRAAIDALEEVGRSEPTLAMHARRKVADAEAPVERVRAVFAQDVAGHAEEAYRTLVVVADGWLATIDGHGPPKVDPRTDLERAEGVLSAFQTEAREAVKREA